MANIANFIAQRRLTGVLIADATIRATITANAIRQKYLALTAGANANLQTNNFCSPPLCGSPIEIATVDAAQALVAPRT